MEDSVTGQQLLNLWIERDERYKTRRGALKLTEYEQDIVRDWRSKELRLARGSVVAARVYLTDWPI